MEEEDKGNIEAKINEILADNSIFECDRFKSL